VVLLKRTTLYEFVGVEEYKFSKPCAEITSNELSLGQLAISYINGVEPKGTHFGMAIIN
jgi:hypothetical protein